MAAVNQDFVTFQGDTVQPIFTVQNAGVAVDISGASEILWMALRNLSSTAAVIKRKSTGGISFTNTGSDGKFTLSLSSTDTAALDDWYIHTATVTDAAGNVTTCTVGRMQVGLPPNWTWSPSQVGLDDLYTVRSLIGDTRQADQLLSDQQIRWARSIYSNVWLAGAECCRMIAANFAVQVDTVQGELKTNYSMRRRAFQSLGIDLEQRGMARGGATAYMGGVSISDKFSVASDADRVQPQFVLGQWDNLLPEAPVGHQTGAADGGATPLPDTLAEFISD